MDANYENPVQPPFLSDRRLAQIRAHVLSATQPRATRRRLLAPRRHVLVALVAAGAVIASLPAIAQDNALWWVHRGNDPFQPNTQVVTLGRWTNAELRIDRKAGSVPTSRFFAASAAWRLQAFVSTDHELCIALAPEAPQPANEGSSVVCGQPVRGTPQRVAPAASDLHWAGFGVSIPGRVGDTSMKIAYGSAAASVRAVDLETNSGTVRVATTAQPPGLDANARFWIVELPVDQIVTTVVPRDEDGHALEHWRLPVGQ